MIREELVVGGTTYDMVDLDWGGSISSGAPSEVVNSRHAALSGDGKLFPRTNIVWSLDESVFAPLRVGVSCVLRIFFDDALVNSVNFWLTEVEITHEYAKVSFSTDSLSLSNIVRLAPTSRHMPAGWDSYSGDPSIKWAAGLGEVWNTPSPLYAVSQSFRAAGYDAVPPRISLGDTIMDVPFQYSCVPEEWDENSGHCTASSSYSVGDSPPTLVRQNGLTFMSDGKIVITPNRDRSWGTINEVTGHFVVGSGATGNSQVMIIYGTGNYVTFNVSSSYALSGSPSKGTYQATPTGAVKPMSVIRFGVSKTRGWWAEVGGTRISGSFTPTQNDSFKVDTFSGARLTATPGGRLAGVQVLRNRFASYAIPGEKDGVFVPSSYVYAPLADFQEFSKGVYDEPARDVLDSAADGLLGSWWIDENNIAQFRDAYALTFGATRRELVFDSDVSSYSITDSDTERRSSINLKYSEVAYSQHRRARVTLFEGPGERFEAGDVSTYLIEPAEGKVEWLGVDWDIQKYTPGGRDTVQPATEGSWIIDADVDGMKNNPKNFRYWVTRLTPWSATCKVEATADTSLITTQGVIESKMKFPYVRGRGRMEYADVFVSVGSADSKAPYTVDSRRWVTTKDAALSLANYLLRNVPTGKPSMSSVTVAYSPGINLGDIIVLRAGTGSTFERRLLVLSVKHPADSLSSTLGVLELSTTRRNMLWSEAESNAVANRSDSVYSKIEANRGASDPWNNVETSPDTYPYGV